MIIKNNLLIRLICLCLWGSIMTYSITALPIKELHTKKNTKPPSVQRIVSLAPSLTESLYLLGVGDYLKGCTTYCNDPEEAKTVTKVGSLLKFNIELIFTLQPDLVLTMELSDNKALEKLQNLGLHVETFPTPKNFNDLCTSFIRLGKLVDREQTAISIVNRAKDELKVVQNMMTGIQQVKVFWQLGAKPLFSATKNFFSNDYIEMAGGINIAADAKSGIYSREEVLKQNPDIIIIITMGTMGINEKKTWQTFTTLNAAKNNRIYIVDADLYCSPTPPTFVRALKELIVLFYPQMAEKFKGHE